MSKNYEIFPNTSKPLKANCQHVYDEYLSLGNGTLGDMQDVADTMLANGFTKKNGSNDWDRHDCQCRWMPTRVWIAVQRGHVVDDAWLYGPEKFLGKWLIKQIVATDGVQRAQLQTHLTNVQGGGRLTQQEIKDMFGDLLRSANAIIAAPGVDLAARIAAEAAAAVTMAAGPAPPATILPTAATPAIAPPVTAPPAVAPTLTASTATTAATSNPAREVPDSENEDEVSEFDEDFGEQTDREDEQEEAAEDDDLSAMANPVTALPVPAPTLKSPPAIPSTIPPPAPVPVPPTTAPPTTAPPTTAPPTTAPPTTAPPTTAPPTTAPPTTAPPTTAPPPGPPRPNPTNQRSGKKNPIHPEQLQVLREKSISSHRKEISAENDVILGKERAAGLPEVEHFKPTVESVSASQSVGSELPTLNSAWGDAVKDLKKEFEQKFWKREMAAKGKGKGEGGGDDAGSGEEEEEG